MNSEINYVSPFKRFCISIGNLPTAYLESMSYYESLTYLVNYLANNVIPALNNNGEVVEELQQKFTELKNYVDTYFDNLDVQEEINNKLDEMVEDGTLDQIIQQYLNSGAIWGFDTVADMKNATNLIDGSYAKTLGYHSIGDGGAGYYLITNTEDNTKIQETVGSLYATLIIQNETVNIKQLGAYGDGIHDDTNILNLALGSSSSLIKKIILNGQFLISNSLIFTSNKDLIGIKNNNQYTATESNIITNENITVLNLANQTNIKIENINITHPDNTTNDIIDLTKSRYIELKNIQVYHSGNTISNCIAINDTNSNDGWSGYITIDNFRCQKYDIGIKSKATFIKIKNCVINQSNTYAIWLLHEGIGGINGCDITGTGKAIRYDGGYSLNLQNNYFEGYYIDTFIENTNNVNFDLTGSKIYIGRENSGRTTSIKSSTVNGELPNNFENTLNGYKNGYPSLRNLTVNGSFENDLLAWTYNNLYVEIKDKTQINNIPVYFNKCCKIGTAENTGYSTLEQQIYIPFNTNEKITIGAWLYYTSTPSEYAGFGLAGLNSDNTWVDIISSKPVIEANKWTYVTLIGSPTEDVTRLRLRVSAHNTNIVYATGITVNKGSSTSMDAEYTPNFEKTITKNLIIKGSDNNYYKLVTDGSTLTFTQVTNLNV